MYLVVIILPVLVPSLPISSSFTFFGTIINERSWRDKISNSVNILGTTGCRITKSPFSLVVVLFKNIFLTLAPGITLPELTSIILPEIGWNSILVGNSLNGSSDDVFSEAEASVAKDERLPIWSITPDPPSLDSNVENLAWLSSFNSANASAFFSFIISSRSIFNNDKTLFKGNLDWLSGEGVGAIKRCPTASTAGIFSNPGGGSIWPSLFVWLLEVEENGLSSVGGLITLINVEGCNPNSSLRLT